MKKFLCLALCLLAMTFTLMSCENTNCTSEKVLTGNVVDVLAKDIYPGEVTIKDGKITSIKRIDGEYDTYILPGFIDAHIHIESTLMTPENYAHMAVENGVVAAICDPHETTNVLGIEGIDYMIDNSKKARFHFNFMLPSCMRWSSDQMSTTAYCRTDDHTPARSSFRETYRTEELGC